MSSVSKPHLAEELLARSRDPTVAADFYLDKIVRKPLYLRPTEEEDPIRDANRTDGRARRQKARRDKQLAQREKKRLKPKPLSAAQKRKLCIYEVPEGQRRYELYVPLHALWVGYMRAVLGLDGQGPYGKSIDAKGAGPMVCSADLHGALVEVVRAKSVGCVGIKGIVLKDTRSTFEVITEGNQIKTVLKKGAIFRIEIPIDVSTEATDLSKQVEGVATEAKNIVLELHGSQFESRPADRATKKVRVHIAPDL